MSYKLSKEIIEYLENSLEETLFLLEQLCKIPAPSGQEEKRAKFCKEWLEVNGAEGVYIDSVNNVIYPVGCENSRDIVVFMAHTDTVFPDAEPMPYRREDKRIYAPGVGDDTICLAIMLMIAKYVAKNSLMPRCGVIFAANSCEEGLGNLKGIKKIMKDFSGKISRVYAFDGQYDKVFNRCVGSHRYKISFSTEGGHSFNDFGNRNAVYAMSDLICRLYQKQVPNYGDSKTTYNVGIVEGGTSVNTIAQNAEMMYEYRSDSCECLSEMQSFFEGEIARAKEDGKADITVETLGVRPCSVEVDENDLAEMTRKCLEICKKHSGIDCELVSASTDCNIPMSLGVPAICVGAYIGSGAHTREEYLNIESVPVGLKIVAELILENFV